MSEMKPLLDGALAADAERILRSAEVDAPSSAEERQARIIDAYATSATATAGSLHAVWRITKWTALAAIVVLAGVLASRSSPTAPMPVAVAVAPGITPSIAPETATTVTPPLESEAGVRVEDLPTASEGIASAKRATPPAPAATAAVEDELLLVDAARAALASGNAERALARVAECRKQYPHPRYAEEADAIEIQALAALGRLDEARAKGERFLAARPHSPYERKVRTAIGAVQP